MSSIPEVLDEVLASHLDARALLNDCPVAETPWRAGQGAGDGPSTEEGQAALSLVRYWALPGGATGRDKAIAALAQGRWQAAADLWETYTRLAERAPIAQHNLALLFLALALDAEGRRAGAGTDYDEGRRAEAFWRASHGYWRQLFASEGHWGLGEPALASALRKHLPAALLGIHVRLAGRSSVLEDCWRRQAALISTSGYPADAIAAAHTKLARAASVAASGACAALLQGGQEQVSADALRRVYEGATAEIAALDALVAWDTACSAPLRDWVAARLADGLRGAASDPSGLARGLLPVAEAALALSVGGAARERVLQARALLRAREVEEEGRRAAERLQERCREILRSRVSPAERLTDLRREIDGIRPDEAEAASILASALEGVVGPATAVDDFETARGALSLALSLLIYYFVKLSRAAVV